MFNYDFIILYEHRNRELENAVLLAMLLEKKGYKVAIEYRWSIRILFQRAHVIITPFLYNNDFIMAFAIHPFFHCKKIINMQYEQLFQEKDEKELNNLPTELAKKAVHISWGRNMTARYKQIGIEPNHIFEVGHISIDLNAPKYRSTFLKKEDLSKRYKISNNKKWLLFISSFAFVGLSKTELEKTKSALAGAAYLSDISYKSQPIILDYFEQLVQSHPEIIIIYRPHPHENACKRLFNLERKYDNFKVIAEFSIRQWILTSDYISTWFSTSLVDVAYANKPCAIIRPVPFSTEFDYPMFRDQNIISDYQGLEDFVSNPGNLYVINKKTIKDYYCNTPEANSFEKLRDICIQMRENKNFEYDYFGNMPISLLFLLKVILFRFFLALSQFWDYSMIVPEKYREELLYAHREMHNYKKDIYFYRNRFSWIVNNEDA